VEIGTFAQNVHKTGKNLGWAVVNGRLSVVSGPLPARHRSRLPARASQWQAGSGEAGGSVVNFTTPVPSPGATGQAPVK